VPLIPSVIKLIKRLKEISNDSIWLFPSRYGGGSKHIEGTSINHALRKNMPILGITHHFSPHDLRRTGATFISGMGTSRLVVDKLLNHVDSSVTGRYDRHRYDKEKRKALLAWGRKVDSIVSGSGNNVVSIAG
jgi:integrase